MASCVMTTAMDACGVKGVEFIQQYISAAMSPMRQILACDPPAMGKYLLSLSLYHMTITRRGLGIGIFFII